ncbi:hypothetical protein Lepto7375DRAFT_0130 [Leptolyngbya sp. PCC 7375]|nr:hypothetical protein Lepto7375DRAFT_0130 [Leptolyngbya sp. PCC 7375]
MVQSLLCKGYSFVRPPCNSVRRVFEYEAFERYGYRFTCEGKDDV